MKGKELIHGLSGSLGTVTGYLKIVNVDVDEPIECNSTDVIVCNNWTRDSTGINFENLKNAAALIQNIGAIGIDGALICMVLEKPCIVQTLRISGNKATDVLKTGLMVVVEGFTGELDVVDESGQAYDKVRYGTVYQYLPDVSREHEKDISESTPPKPMIRPRPKN